MSITTTISVNQTICGCDGGLTVSTIGGNPPYSYSINNGISFNNFPIYTNLCQGNYIIVVNDISGNTSTNFATLNPPSNPITYTVYLNTTSKIINTSQSVITKEYTTSVVIFPELNSGTTVNFSLNHSQLLSSSPNLNSATGTTTSVLEIDTIPISATTSGITTGSTFNPIPGCQNQTLYLTTYNETWDSINITSNTTFTLTTTDTLYKNEFVDCYIGNSEHKFSLSNLSINGCSCCSVITS